jgi:hypothetical protein
MGGLFDGFEQRIVLAKGLGLGQHSFGHDLFHEDANLVCQSQITQDFLELRYKTRRHIATHCD